MPLSLFKEYFSTECEARMTQFRRRRTWEPSGRASNGTGRHGLAYMGSETTGAEVG